MSRNDQWSDEDTEQLRRHIAGGGSVATAAVRFKRSEPAVRTRAKILGLRFPTIKERREKALGTRRFVSDF